MRPKMVIQYDFEIWFEEFVVAITGSANASRLRKGRGGDGVPIETHMRGQVL